MWKNPKREINHEGIGGDFISGGNNALIYKNLIQSPHCFSFLSSSLFSLLSNAQKKIEKEENWSPCNEIALGIYMPWTSCIRL